MRRIWLILPAAVAIGCSDRTVSTAPGTEDPQLQPDANAIITAVNVPSPIEGDRILIDSRTSLQEAGNGTQAARAVGAQWLVWPWRFTRDVDGQGTNALRIDWPRRWNRCTYESASLPVRLPRPKSNRLFIQWKQHLGRTATGGGVGEVGAFTLSDHFCKNGRSQFTLLRQDEDRGERRIEYRWTQTSPITPTIFREGDPALEVGALPTAAINFEHFAGQTITQTLYVEAESAPGAADGILALFINSDLVLLQTKLSLDASEFRRARFPGRFPLARQRQSEYYWDFVIWEPVAEFPDDPQDVPPVGSVTLVPETARLSVGSAIDLAATVRDVNGNIIPGIAVTWGSSDDATATVSSAGRVTGVAPGEATITASAGGQSATATITVDEAPPAPVASIEITPATATVQIGSTVQLAAVARDAAGNILSGRTIAWSSDNAAIATVSESGLVSGIAAGAATISASSEGVSATAAVTVTPLPPPPVATVTVAPATASIVSGQTHQLTATLRDADNNVLSDRAVAWTSSDDDVATVSATGLVSAVAPGTATITATSERVSGTAAITVTPVPVASVTVTPGTATVEVGSTVQLSAVARDADGNTLTGRSITWSSNSTGIATVSTSGLVRGVAAGSATITATSEGVNGTSTIAVPAPPVDGTPPSVPQNVVAVAAGPTVVNLNWSPSTDNVAVTGYRVFRNGAQVGAPGGPTFQDGGLSPSTSYSYTAAAVDAAGNVSSQSNPVSVTTPGTGGGSIGSALPVRLPLSLGATFYVAPNGSDANPGTLVAPWRTIQKALNALQPGQKAFVRAGTYREALRFDRAGTASAPITIEAYPGERPIIDGEHTRRPLVIESGGAYFRIKGFILDRDCCTSGGHIDVYGHHVEIVDNEMRNGRGKGVYTEEASRFVHIIGNWIHHNVTPGGQQDHGIYLQGFDHFVANNVIHDHPDGFGIQIYDSGTRMIVVNNTVTNNGHSGIVVGGSGGVSNVTIRNNILANNNFYGVQMDSSCPTSNVVITHNVIFGNGDGAIEGGCSSVSASNNILADPLFVNSGSSTSRDLRVRAGSLAINAAHVDFAMPITFGNAVRDALPDMGAYEFGVQ